MEKGQDFGSRESIAFQQSHGLDSFCPLLRAYLAPGLEVLDVGCGPGTITVGAAGLIGSGHIVGVDREPGMIEAAQALAGRSGAGNARFQACDAYSLGFPDGTFDVVYSSALLVWLRDPVLALREQKRVAKRGGWVLANIGDYGIMIRYPAGPALDAVWQSLRVLNDLQDSTFFVNLFAGRESRVLFHRAGFSQVTLVGNMPPMETAYPGSERFDFWYTALGGVLDERSPALRSLREKLVQKAGLSQETISAARKELEEWHAHPDALFMTGGVFAAGRVE
jgi:SAM-dependent methyltransferase